MVKNDQFLCQLGDFNDQQLIDLKHLLRSIDRHESGWYKNGFIHVRVFIDSLLYWIEALVVTIYNKHLLFARKENNVHTCISRPIFILKKVDFLKMSLLKNKTNTILHDVVTCIILLSNCIFYLIRIHPGLWLYTVRIYKVY